MKKLVWAILKYGLNVSSGFLVSEMFSEMKDTFFFFFFFF